MRSESRRVKLEKTFEERDTLNQAVVRIVNESARDQEGNANVGGSRPPQSEGDQQSKINSPRRRETRLGVSNNIHQFKIPAHRLNRSRSAQEINKHVSDGVRAENKPKTAKTEEAKDFSKSEAELVDVMDTFQHVIAIIEKEMAKNLAFLQKEISTRNTNNATAALTVRKTPLSTAFSKQCQ